MYVISEVMKRVREPLTKLYEKSYQQAMELDANELFEQLKDVKMEVLIYPNPYPNLNVLVTTGCNHLVKGGVYGGCSMCGNYSQTPMMLARINALRKKDAGLYAKIVRLSFENRRGKVREQTVNEVVTGSDLLDDNEFPDQVYEEVFGPDGVFEVRPFRYSFEVRADSVVYDKIKKLVDHIGKGRVYFEFGVETGDDWLRNHWINKNVTNKHIEKAIAIMHELRCKVNANLLIGIPGLTEEQSIKSFIDAVKWLYSLGVDRMTFFPLNIKRYTLNNYLYENFRDNKKLSDIGIAQGKHTGLPWMFTVVETLVQAFTEVPGASKNFGIAQFNNYGENADVKLTYNSDSSCQCNKELFGVLDRLIKTGKTEELMAVRETMKQDSCYKDYLQLLEKQKAAGNVKNTLSVVMQELSEYLWPENCGDMMSAFSEELGQYSL